MKCCANLAGVRRHQDVPNPIFSMECMTAALLYAAALSALAAISRLAAVQFRYRSQDEIQIGGSGRGL
jgi:hypothetical protein